MVFIYYVFLLVMQIFLLFKTVKNNYKNNWIILFTTIGLSMMSVGLLFVTSILSAHFIGWNVLVYIVLSLIAAVLYFLMLIISLIMRLICGSKKSNSSFKNIFNICIVVIIVSLIFTVTIESIPYIIKERNDKINMNNAQEKVIEILNQKYGNGQFKIEKMEEANVCKDCMWLSKIDGYKFTISTSYMNSDFTVDMEKSNLKISNDEFLDDYYKEKNGIENLEDYIQEYKLDQLNKEVSNHYNVTISFNNVFVKDFEKKDYERVPSLDELAKNVRLLDPKVEINENLTSKDALLNYLVDFTSYFISDLDTSNFEYSQTSKYFRYKYDYSKLGVTNYSDQYNGYGGYVLAGDYKYSEEKGHYVIENEDSIIRINIMGDVKTLNKEDVLKKTITGNTDL